MGSSGFLIPLRKLVFSPFYPKATPKSARSTEKCARDSKTCARTSGTHEATTPGPTRIHANPTNRMKRMEPFAAKFKGVVMVRM
eukprot:82154-Pleurochrysis_carterae.AAC.1